jgi:5'-methylthioadenosine phosphorylase
MVTDYDCWHPEHEHVSVDAVIRVLLANADKARALVRRVIPALASLPMDPHDSCYTALEAAIITPPDARDPELVRKLDAVAGRILRRG